MPRPRAFVLRAFVLALVAQLAAACAGDSADLVVPEDTAFLVSVSTALNSQFNRPGDEIRVRLERDVRVNDAIAIGAGQSATLRISDARAAEGNRPASLTMCLVAVDLPTGRRPLQTYQLELVGAMANEPVSANGRVLGQTADLVEKISTRGPAIVLPAGQRIRLVTSQPMSMPSMD